MIKYKQTKNPKLLKGTALAFAGLLVAGTLPTTLGTENVKASTPDTNIYLLSAQDTANVGGTYPIRTAYFGDSKIPVGLSNYSDYSGVSASSVKVTYVSTGVQVKTYNSDFEESTTKDTDDNIKSEVGAGVANNMTYGAFNVENAGAYNIEYSITVNSQKYTMNFEVNASRSSASMSFAENTDIVFPTVYDLSMAKTGETYKDITLPLPTIFDENDNEVEGVKFYAESQSPALADTDYVKISIKGPQAKTVAINETEGVFTVSGASLNELNVEGEFSVTYKYYTKANGASKGQFVSSESKTFTLKKNYYVSDYQVKANASTPKKFDTGVETEVPTVTASATFKNSAGTTTTEEVNVKYSVAVKYSEKSDGTWVDVEEKVTDGKFKPSKDGQYKFIYTVTDFYGNSAKISDQTIDVSDTKDPEVFMYDAGASENYKDGNIAGEIADYVDASAKLKTKTNDKNVVLYAIGAKDNASKLDKIELTRKISRRGGATIEVTEYNNYNLVFNYSLAEGALDEKDLLGSNLKGKTPAQADTWLKEHNYLKVVNSLTDETVKGILESAGLTASSELSAVKAKLVENGYAYVPATHVIESTGNTDPEKDSGVSYTVIYSAKDEAGHSATSPSYSMLIMTSVVEATKAPIVNISTSFDTSYTKDEVIKFVAPTVADAEDIDGRMDVVTTYQYFKDLTTPSDIKPEVVVIKDKYEVDLSTAPSDANYVVIKASAVNDFGLEGTFEKKIEIATINDSDIPTATVSSGISGVLEQNEEITLPTIVYEDEYVALMNASVSVYLVDDAGNKSPVSSNDPSGYVNLKTKTYTFEAGKMIASFAGKYEVVVTATDPANNYISSYFYFTVAPTDNEFYRLNTPASINGGKTVVGEKFTFDTPTLSYHTLDGKEVRGISDDSTNTVDLFSVRFISGPTNPKKVGKSTTFTVSEPGTYKFQYVAWIDIYETATSTTTTKEIYSDIYTIVASAGTNSKKYEVNFGENGKYEDFYGLNDTITLYSVGGDADIDKDKSTVTVSWSGPSSGSVPFNLSDFQEGKTSYEHDALGNIKYPLKRNGTYTITYKIVDSKGKEYVASNDKSSYTLKVGDYERPEISFKEGAFKDEYSLNENLAVNIADIIFTDNGVGAGDSDADKAMRDALVAKMTVRLYRKDDSGNWIDVENKGDASTHIYSYDLTVAGEYKLSVKTEDEVGWSNDSNNGVKTFTVSTDSVKTNNGKTTKIVGIVLIVLACLVLVGVVAYFVISKIKSDKKSGKLASKKKNSKK